MQCISNCAEYSNIARSFQRATKVTAAADSRLTQFDRQ